MGTDIHMIVQARAGDARREEVGWEVVPRPSYVPPPECFEDQWWTWCRSRNYCAFGILAGVRCEHRMIVDRLRGLPSDHGLSVKLIDIWLGEHSRHHLTLRELEVFPYWDEVIPHKDEWRPGLTYAHAAGEYHAVLIPALRRYADERGLAHDDVRILMGFDS